MSSRPAETRRGRLIVAGAAAGRAVVADGGLSFAMGFDVGSGLITDVHSPARGMHLTGRVLVMPSGRGSSSASAALAESLRLGTGPAAIILREIDEILAIGAIVARRLYGRTCPILMVGAGDYAAIRDGDLITIEKSGTFRLS